MLKILVLRFLHLMIPLDVKERFGSLARLTKKNDSRQPSYGEMPVIALSFDMQILVYKIFKIKS